MRGGFVASRVGWENRAGSGGDDATAGALARATIAQTIRDDDDLRHKHALLTSIKGVGDALAAVILAELPDQTIVASAS